MNWCSKGDETEAKRQRGRRNRGREAERHRAQRQSEWDEMWGEVFWRFEWNWAEVGLVLSQTVRSGFFFFWISAWIGCFGRYGRFRPKSAWFGSRWRASKPRRLASAKTTWHDVAGCAGSGVPCASPRPAASDAGAAPLVPHPCFPGWMLVLCKTGC